MRLFSYLIPVLAAFIVGALAVVDETDPVTDSSKEAAVDAGVEVTAQWLESNPFGHVVNGEKNTIMLTIGTNSTKNYTILNIAGSVHHPQTGALIKNLTTQKLGAGKTNGVPLIPGARFQLPYVFFSEFKPGDIRLSVWLEGTEDDAKYRIDAYDSIITIVEPEGSLMDFKLISTYLMVAAIFGGLTYVAYQTLFPQSKKPRPRRTATAPATPAAGTSTGTGYEEEWIPEHHLKKKKTGGMASGTSGDELSGSEAPKLNRRKSGRK